MLFVLREKIIALLRGGESRVSLLVGFGRSKDAQTLGISNYIPRIRVLRSSWNRHVSTKSSRAGPVYRNEYNYTSNSFPRETRGYSDKYLVALLFKQQKNKKRKEKEGTKLPSFSPD